MQRKQLVPVVAIGLVVLVTIGVAVQSRKKPKPAPVPAPVALRKPEAPIVETTLSEFLTSYAENAIAADERYRDKPVRVTGIVVRVTKDAIDAPVVVFRVGVDRELPATFAKADGLAAVKRSQVIAIRCKGESVLGPALVDCVYERTVE